MRRYQPVGVLILIPALCMLLAAPGCGGKKPEETNKSGDKKKNNEESASPGKEKGTKGSPAKVAGWGTIKGRVVWGGDALPEKKEIKVTVDQGHCLEQGKLYDSLFEVDSKTKGLKNVFAALKQPPDNDNPLPIHPDLKEVPKKPVVLDQPHCLFIPRALAIREGQELHTKNTAPVNHNIKWTGDPEINPGGNQTITPGADKTIKDLKAQPLPLVLQCNIHPWMSGRLAVYDHPYFAVTDKDGNFEIKKAPAGTYRLTFYHEGIGWRGGAKGKAGQEITVNPNQTTDLGEVKMGGK